MRTNTVRSSALGSASPVHGVIDPRGKDGKGIRAFRFANDNVETITAVYQNLHRMGIQLPPAQIQRMMAAMDENPQPSVTTPSITTPVQFLQNWLPGFVNVITAARKIDVILGLMTAGAWEDQEIVQGAMEQLAKAQPYTDYSNVPLSSWNANWERRTVVRQEMGMRSGVLDAARSARVNINDAQQKRDASALQLEIVRNRIGFYGFNDGLGRTYGLLNDPNLPAAGQFPIGASGSRAWTSKNFQEITQDIRTALSALRVQSQENINPGGGVEDGAAASTPITMVLPMNQVDALSTTTDYGQSVRAWLTATYPNVRVVSAPELDGAVGDVDVCYFQADKINDTSTDDGRVWLQVVPAKFRLIGVQQMVKGYEEDYSMATAGALLKRPWAVVRYLFG